MGSSCRKSASNSDSIVESKIQSRATFRPPRYGWPCLQYQCPARAIQSHYLQAVKWSVLTEMAGQLTKIEDIATGTGHTEKRPFGPLRLNGNQGGPLMRGFRGWLEKPCQRLDSRSLKERGQG